MAATLRLRVDDTLRFFLRAAHRDGGDVPVPLDGTSSVGHLVQSAGVPLTEVGALRVGDRTVAVTERPDDGWPDGTLVSVNALARPQLLAAERFLLDVHFGRLARRMRLLGLDAAYRNDASDDELVAQALAERRVLLTRDRGILRRSAVQPAPYARAAHVRGSDADEQVADVLDRFAPRCRPFSRCPRCNGELTAAAKQDVTSRLEHGTRRSYEDFAQCTGCAAVYWRGAHSGRLEAIVRAAGQRIIGGRSSSAEPRR